MTVADSAVDRPLVDVGKDLSDQVEYYELATYTGRPAAQRVAYSPMNDLARPWRQWDPQGEL